MQFYLEANTLKFKIGHKIQHLHLQLHNLLTQAAVVLICLLFQASLAEFGSVQQQQNFVSPQGCH